MQPDDVIVSSSPAACEAHTDDEDQCQQAKKEETSREAPTIEGNREREEKHDYF